MLRLVAITTRARNCLRLTLSVQPSPLILMIGEGHRVAATAKLIMATERVAAVFYMGVKNPPGELREHPIVRLDPFDSTDLRHRLEYYRGGRAVVIGSIHRSERSLGPRGVVATLIDRSRLGLYVAVSDCLHAHKIAVVPVGEILVGRGLLAGQAAGRRPRQDELDLVRPLREKAADLRTTEHSFALFDATAHHHQKGEPAAYLGSMAPMPGGYAYLYGSNSTDGLSGLPLDRDLLQFARSAGLAGLFIECASHPYWTEDVPSAAALGQPHQSDVFLYGL